MMYTQGRPRRGRSAVTFLVLVAFFALSLGSSALAWDDCPKGLVNDPYPGHCRLYVDTNGDGICDHSQPEPNAATTTVSESTSSTSVSSAPTSTSTSNAPTTTPPTTTKDEGSVAAVTLSTPPSTSGGAGGSGQAGSGGDSEAATPVKSKRSALTVEYNLSPIAIGFFLVYAASFILYRTKRIKVSTHRKVWNVLLLLTFLMTGVLGLLLVIRLNYGVQFRLPFDMLFWHVETGIVMTLISFFHIGWHLKYYKNIFLRRHHERDEVRRAPERARPGPAIGQRGAFSDASAMRTRSVPLERDA